MEQETAPLHHSPEDTLPDTEYLEEISINPRVKAEIETAQKALEKYIPDQEERNRAVRHQMERLLGFARVDGLTGLLNREGFDDRLKLELKRTTRTGQLALLLLDVDRFKDVNDGLGHHVGDLLLARIAQLLANGRAGDIQARTGGDEFAIILPGVAIGAIVVASHIRKEIEAIQIREEPRASGIVTASIGIAISSPGDTALSLYQRADEGTYWTKNYGKNGISVMSTPQNTVVPESTRFPRTYFIPPDAGPAPRAKGR